MNKTFQTNIFNQTKNDVLEDYFNLWRKKGFPDYEFKDYNRNKELEDLIKFDENSLVFKDTLKQVMNSTGFLWCYFPHWKDIKFGNGKSLRSLWENDKELKELIRKTYEWEVNYGNGFITTNRIRQNAKVYLSKQSVSNFRPTVAKFIYNTYGNKGVIWDMSAGWGGRLFGFLASNCKKYIGTEPSTETYKGLLKLKNDFKTERKEVELICKGSEDYLPEKESLDLCFTSPPYFDTEKYANEETQSYIKFPTKELWLKEFYEKTLLNCLYGLKKGGYLIINIADTTKYKFLEDHTKNFLKEMELVKIWKMELSSIAGKGVKYEPIFVFKK